MEAQRVPDLLTSLSFVALVALVGGNLVAIRISGEEMDPFWNAGVRFMSAAMLFGVLLVVWGVQLPPRKDVYGGMMYGAVGIALYFGLIYSGLVDAEAGFAAVVLALTPLLTLMLATLLGMETLSFRGVLGGLIALGGVAVLFDDQLSRDVPAGSVLFLLLAATAEAASMVIAKRFIHVNPVAMNTVAMSAAGPMLLTAAVLSGDVFVVPNQTDTWVSLIYLTTVGTIGVFLLLLFVVKRWTASASSYLFVLAPAVSVPTAALLLDEPVTSLFLAGSFLIVVGVYVGVFGTGWRRATVQKAET